MIYLNEKELDLLHIGDKDIERVLLGDKLIWQNNQVFDLGSTNRYDVKTLLPDIYETLTTDNFFFLTFSTAYGEGSALRSGLSKQYYPSSGYLEFYSWVQNHEFSTHAICVTKPNKLPHIGVGQTFNIRNMYPSSYMNFTADNFVVKDINHNNYIYTGSEQGYNYLIFNKTYDPSTGILNINANDRGTLGSANWNRYWDCDVYLLRKRL